MRASIFCVSKDRSVREALRAIAPACGAALRMFATPDEFVAHHPAISGGAPAECLVADADAAGARFAAALRAGGVKMPVVLIVTGDADPRAALGALGHGGWAVVEAPVTADALEAAIRRALDYDRWRREESRVRALRARAVKLSDDLRKASAVELTAQLLHELSQPLTAINAWAGVGLNQARAGASGAALAEPLELLARESRRATEILRAFRALSRRLEPEIGPIDLNAALVSVAELVEGEAGAAGIDVRLMLAPNLPAATGDAALVELCIFILCRNALDALIERPVGRKEIALRSAARGEELVATVSDTGPGLDEAMLDRLFKPLASPKTNRVGIGLAVCRTMLEALGGRLWLESNTPDGASFALALPRG